MGTQQSSNEMFLVNEESLIGSVTYCSAVGASLVIILIEQNEQILHDFSDFHSKLDLCGL